MEEVVMGTCGMAEDAVDGFAPNFLGDGTVVGAGAELIVGSGFEMDQGIETGLNYAREDDAERINPDSESGVKLNSGDVLADTSDRSGEPPSTESVRKNNDVSFKGSIHHFYCSKCGHTWYAPGWPSYCPKWGCTGTPTEM